MGIVRRLSVFALFLPILLVFAPSCGRDPCEGVMGTCLALELVAGPGLPGSIEAVAIEISGAARGRQDVSEPIRLPSTVALELPAVSGEVSIVVVGRLPNQSLVSGAGKTTVTQGFSNRLPITLLRADDANSPCGVSCPLGCNFAEKRCYGPDPSNLTAPLESFFILPDPPALEITGTVYLDTSLCRLTDEGLNPILQDRHRATKDADQGMASAVCVLGVTAMTLSPGSRLVVYSSADSPSTKPAAILARSRIQIHGTLDVRGCLRDRLPSHAAGPGGYWGAHRANSSQVDTCGGGDGDRSGLSPGGGGGAHVSAGGSGGSPTMLSVGGRGGIPVQNGATLTPLRGGCGGGLPGGLADTAEGGGGGGAIQLLAAQSIEIGQSGMIDVSGCGARAASAMTTGGAGGGAGGGILIETPTLLGSGFLVAAGGGGAGVLASGQIGGSMGGGAGGKMAGQPGGGKGAGDLATLSGGVVSEGPGAPGERTTTQGGGGGGGLGRVRLNVLSSTEFKGTVVAAQSKGMPIRK